MFGIGGFELFIILLFGFLVFGPDKLPEIARTVGAALRKFKQAQEEMEAVIKDEVLDPEKPQGKTSTTARPRSGAKPQPKAAASTTSQESFAQRKARFDKERSELKQQTQEAQRREANRRAMKDAASKKAAEAQAHAADQTAAVVGGAAARQAAAVSDQAPVPSLTPDELFGLKPVKGARSQSGAQSTSAQMPVGDTMPASGAESPTLERGDN